METVQILGYFGALAVGLVLGMLGSGGSIVAVPIFVYMFQISPVTTTAYSLFVVGTSASLGTLKNFKKGLVDFKIAMVFAIPAFVAVYAVRKFLVPIIPDHLITVGSYVLTKSMGIMLLFAILMIVASIFMIRKKKQFVEDEKSVRYYYPLMIGGGVLIGVLTGVVGIGGGFLIIPALVLLVKLPMEKAIATSLLIISLKSLIGFTGDLGNLEINWSFLLMFTMLSISGMYVGIYLSSFIKGEKLKMAFGWLVFIMAVSIIYKELI